MKKKNRGWSVILLVLMMLLMGLLLFFVKENRSPREEKGYLVKQIKEDSNVSRV